MRPYDTKSKIDKKKEGAKILRYLTPTKNLVF
jgi:hypothetical protein